MMFSTCDIEPTDGKAYIFLNEDALISVLALTCSS